MEGSGSDNNRRERERDAEENEADQSSRLHPEAEDVAESGPSREEKNGDGKEVVAIIHLAQQ